MEILISCFVLGFLIVVYFMIRETANLKRLKRAICDDKTGMLCSYFIGEERITAKVISFDYQDETVYMKDERGKYVTIPLNDIYGI